MSGSRLVLQALRDTLRARGVTYKQLAAKLGLSEVTVKRDLSRGDFSLKRLDAICEALEINVADLLRNDGGGQILTRLSAEQEQALVSEPKLLLVTFLVINDWKFGEILSTYRVDENELVSLLLRLDALHIVDYRPPQRIRKLTARNFSWRNDGPVHAFFLARVVPEFFAGAFEQLGDGFHFMGGTLSDASRQYIAAGMERLAHEFEELARQDARLPFDARNGCSAVFALRKWEFSGFAEFRK